MYGVAVPKKADVAGGAHSSQERAPVLVRGVQIAFALVQPRIRNERLVAARVDVIRVHRRALDRERDRERADAREYVPDSECRRVALRNEVNEPLKELRQFAQSLLDSDVRERSACFSSWLESNLNGGLGGIHRLSKPLVDDLD